MNELEKAFEIKNIIDTLLARVETFIPDDKKHIPIKNAILMVHNTLEGIINLLLSRYYLGKEIEKNDKDKVNHFWINVLVEINFAKKIRILGETKIVNANVINALIRINDIRNDLAHYPHRIYKRKDRHLLYNGKHIFKDVEALRMLYNDFDIILQQANKFIINSR